MKCILFLLVFSVVVLGQKQITTEFNLNQSTVNRSIALFGNFPKSYSGGSVITSYTLKLLTPRVELLQGMARITLTVQFRNPVIGFKELEVSPQVKFNYSLTSNGILAEWENLGNYINGLNIPTVIKEILIAKLSEITIPVYPAKLVDFFDDLVPNTTATKVSPEGWAFNIITTPDNLKISVTLALDDDYPGIKMYSWNHTKFIIQPNVNIEVKELFLGVLSGEELMHITTSTSISKNGSAEFLITNPDLITNNSSGRFLSVKFKSEQRGEFIVMYSAGYLPVTNQMNELTYILNKKD